MPLVPAGASGVRARTRWTMLSVKVVLAEGDEDLLAGDPVGAVVLLHGLGAQGADVGAGVGLGEVHGRRSTPPTPCCVR